MGGDWLEEIHEAAASLMLAIVALHIVGVIVTSRLSGQKLIRAMVSGRIMGAVISVIGLPPMYGMT
ncbi:cytochrome b/b6 domain-containing protein [Methyloparacoccus murrellii]